MRTSNIYLPSNYDPTLDESYYAAPRLSEFGLKCLINDTKFFANHNWRTDSRFMASSATQFINCKWGTGAWIGESIAIAFYSWKDATRTTKVATLWLGSWHHAPLIAWTGGILAIGDPKIKINFLPKYSDLIH